MNPEKKSYGSKNYSGSEYQDFLRWKAENQYFQGLAHSAIQELQQLLKEEEQQPSQVSQIKKALEFDGVDDYVHIGQEDKLSFGGSQAFSLECWINPRLGGKGGVVVGKHNGGVQGEYLLLITEKGNVQFHREVAPWSIQTEQTVPFGQFSHIAATYDGKDQKIYINGKLVKSEERGSMSTDDRTPVLIGATWRLDSPFAFFDGLISEVRIWNVACTKSQIKERMSVKLTENEKELVGYWLFENGEGDKVPDLSKSKYDALLGNGKEDNKPIWKDSSQAEKVAPKVKEYLPKVKEYLNNFQCKKGDTQTASPSSQNRTNLKIKNSKIKKIQDDRGKTASDEGKTTQYLQLPIFKKYLDEIKEEESSVTSDDRITVISLPGSVDLSYWCSPVEDQDSLNSCTANAAIALMEYFQKKRYGKYISASRLFLYKVTRNLMQVSGNVGTSIRETMKAMALFGVPPEEYWSYNPGMVDDEPRSFCYAFAQNYQALQYFRLDPAGIPPKLLLAQIKAILVASFPCVFGFTMYRSIYDNSNPRGYIPFPHERDRAEGGHAVVAVGYDDYKVIKNADGCESKGALLIRNSWGTDWGEGGYGWLPYDYVLRGLTADWWSLLQSEWFDTGEFGLGGDDWTSDVGNPGDPTEGKPPGSEAKSS